MTEMTTPSPRLTRLEMQGFKSFASRTVFLFQGGITAIIGPNGSGKSNISDGVRWVLGEQSHSSLRSKKTEDVIFAGGQGRAPMSLAEVSVTFDNSDGWLPTEFAEVTITRRATRAGENSYLINGRKVRLKDVQQLTASLGQSYTVVGQGLVDAALSQRAEERRGLFEHAADLTGLRMKAQEAERNLNEALANAARTRDILADAEPRLRSLERAARQAREWKGVHDHLRNLQLVHFRALLEASSQNLARAESGAGADESVVTAAQSEADQLAATLATARQEAETARELLEGATVRLQSTLDSARRISHERDLAVERLAALARRREDMADTQRGLDEQAASVETDLAAANADVEQAAAELELARVELQAVQADAQNARSGRAGLERQAAELATAVAVAERKLADLGRRRAVLQGRQESEAAESERASAQAAERGERISQLGSELAAFEQDEAAAVAALADLDAKLADLAEQLASATADERTTRDAVAALDRRTSEAAARLEALERIQASGAGLFAGVREVMNASRDGKLAGIRGTLAELVKVPSTFDTALEVALGSHLQDIVVDRWADAETAINHLKRVNAGRATFQPIDTVRANRSAPAASVLGLAGVHGVAADLVSHAPELAAIVGGLLGRTIVVDDLPVARQALPNLQPGWSVVTLSGEIARSGGSVSGGAAVRESGILGRERELRELPGQIETLQLERATLIAAQEAAAERPRQVTEQRRALEDERATLLATRRERGSQRDRLRSWLEDLRRESAASDRRAEALAEATVAAGEDLARIEADERTVTEEITALSADRDRIVQLMSADAGDIAAVEERLAAAGRSLATLEERVRAERRRLTALQAQQAGLRDERALRAERAAALDGEIEAITAQRDRLEQEAAAMEASRATAETERAPVEADLRAREAAISHLEQRLDAAREALLEAERAWGSSGLAVERARGELHAINQRIIDDLELEDPADLLGMEMPEGVESADGEREIARLKERLRRVGYIGEDAVAEYEREAERSIFLRAQLEDIDGAAAALRELLDGLQEEMKTRFEATFTKVAEAFSESFTTLFGGGTAKLQLVPGEDGEPAGVDIVAQPPGKRLQSLALLSGGERSLTAAALLFAILKVNPTPFVLLDEVDAALDEANVVRFREELQSLAAGTQAIIITHNRGTIEVADTLYGVSMREDGVSQVLSLRLAETAEAV